MEHTTITASPEHVLDVISAVVAPPRIVDTPCKWCNCLRSRCDEYGPGRKCCPDCRHPKRIQRTRVKGSRLPMGAVSVARPSRYGNPFRVVGSSVVGMEWSDVVEWDCGIGAMPNADVLYVSAADRYEAVDCAVGLYRELLRVRQRDWRPARFEKWIRAARGYDVACYCPLDHACHGDALLETANATQNAGHPQEDGQT